MRFSFLSKKKYVTLTTKETSVEKDNTILDNTIDRDFDFDKEKDIKLSETADNNSETIWIKCPSCNEIIYNNDLKQNLKKCTNCNYYFSMSVKERVDLIIDENTFQEMDKDILSQNPLDFPGYKEKYESAVSKTEMNEGVLSGVGDVFGIKVSIAVMNFDFLGGSMGSVVGEKITRTIERGIELKIPVIIVSSSGGARMHEGILSLMQMAKTSGALEKLRENGIPFISIPVNPTTGGVTASFAMLGDIIMTEPNALIGFAGQRVIEQTIKQKLPKGFQRSEFLQECGMIDVITEREEMKKNIFKILDNIL